MRAHLVTHLLFYCMQVIIQPLRHCSRKQLSVHCRFTCNGLILFSCGVEPHRIELAPVKVVLTGVLTGAVLRRAIEKPY
jgi:hypothetical protein